MLLAVRPRSARAVGAQLALVCAWLTAMWVAGCSTWAPPEYSHRIAEAERGLEEDPAIQARRDEVEAALARERSEVGIDEFELRVQNEYDDDYRLRMTARVPVPNPNEVRARREVRRAETQASLSRLEEAALSRRGEVCFRSVESAAHREQSGIYEAYARRQTSLLEWNDEWRRSGSLSERTATRFEIETRIKLATRRPGPAPEPGAADGVPSPPAGPPTGAVATEDPARIVATRVGRHASFDRLVLEFDRSPGVVRDPSAERGGLILQLAARPGEPYTGAIPLGPRMARVQLEQTPGGARLVAEAASGPVTAFELRAPPRLVIDFGDAGGAPPEIPEAAVEIPEAVVAEPATGPAPEPEAALHALPPHALPPVGQRPDRLVRAPALLRDTVRTQNPSVAVHDAISERYQALSAREASRARTWLKFFDLSYEPVVPDDDDEELGVQFALRIPFGVEARADMSRYRALSRAEAGEGKQLLYAQMRRGLAALEELDYFEASAEQWEELLALAHTADAVGQRWWKQRLATPSQVGALFDQAYAARNAVLDARERAGMAGCTLLAMTGVPLDAWPRE